MQATEQEGWTALSKHWACYQNVTSLLGCYQILAPFCTRLKCLLAHLRASSRQPFLLIRMSLQRRMVSCCSAHVTHRIATSRHDPRQEWASRWDKQPAVLARIKKGLSYFFVLYRKAPPFGFLLMNMLVEPSATWLAHPWLIPDIVPMSTSELSEGSSIPGCDGS